MKTKKMIEGLEKFGENWRGLLILSAIPFFIVLFPVLVLDYGFNWITVDHFQQGLSFYKDAILTGQSIFWSPYLLSGFPVFADVTGGFLSPVTYLFFRFLPVDLAYNWLIFLYLTLAAFFTGLFLKNLGVSLWSRYIAGLVFAFGQWTFFNDITVSSVRFLLPLLFLLILKSADSRGWKRFAFVSAGSLSVGFGWLTGHWQFLIEALVGLGIFALFLFFKKGRSLKPILNYISMVLGGFIIGLFQFVPALVFILLSSRTQQFTHWGAVQGGVRFRDLIGLFLPYFNFPLDTLATSYIDYWGILPLIFLAVALFNFSNKKGWRRFFDAESLAGKPFFFSWLFVFSAAMSINYSPLFWLLHHLPGFNLLQMSGRWMLVTTFSAAVLSAFGLDLILGKFEEYKKSLRVKIVSVVLKWAIVILAMGAAMSFFISIFFKERILAFFDLYFYRFLYPKTSGLPLEHYYEYIERLFGEAISSFGLLNPRFLVPFLALLTAFSFFRFYVLGKISKKYFAFLSAALVFLGFSSVFLFGGFLLPMEILDSEPETVKFLKNHEQGRIFSIMRSYALTTIGLGAHGNSPDRAELERGLLFPNKNEKWKIESIDFGICPMQNRPMSKLVSYVGGEAFNPGGGKLDNSGKSSAEEIKIIEARKPILDFLGAKYLIGAASLSEDIFPKIFEGKITSKKIPVAIYENKEARPLYYFTEEDWFLGGGEEIAPDIFIEKFQEGRGEITQEGIVLIERKNASLVLSTNTASPRLLVFSQNNLPGWRAYVDGEESELLSVASVYMGVSVPAGHHVVSFEYSYWEIWNYFFKFL